MSAPSEGDNLALKRLGRYLQGAPRLVHRVDWQGNPGHITAMTDSGGFFIFLGLATLFLL